MIEFEDDIIYNNVILYTLREISTWIHTRIEIVKITRVLYIRLDECDVKDFFLVCSLKTFLRSHPFERCYKDII